MQNWQSLGADVNAGKPSTDGGSPRGIATWDARAAVCAQERAGTGGGTGPLLRSAPAYLRRGASASTLMIGSLLPARWAPGMSLVARDGHQSSALVNRAT